MLDDFAVQTLKRKGVVEIGEVRERHAVGSAPARIAGRGSPVDRGRRFGTDERGVGEQARRGHGV